MFFIFYGILFLECVPTPPSYRAQAVENKQAICYEIYTNVDYNSYCVQLRQKNFMVQWFSILDYGLFNSINMVYVQYA